jgi:phosphatidate phosphatase APP1
MSNWQERIAPWVRAVERRYDRWKYRLYYALGGPRPITIQPYRGYGTRHRVHVFGRVLEERGIQPPSETDRWWNNLLNMVKRLQSREVPHARLRVRYAGVGREVIADEEGMFDLWLEPTEHREEGRSWQQVEIELVEPLSQHQSDPVKARGEVLIPSPKARFGVISDLDDTVIQSDVSNLLQMARTVLLSNARTRMPLPGAAAFYRALRAGADGDGANPLFYVSNGLWNLYDLLEDFFALNDMPEGPVMLLRNWGVYEDEILPTRQRAYKLGVIRPILDLYEDLPFILIGDSSEADPEIYHELVHVYGERILAVYIRNVSRDLDRPRVIRKLADEIVDAGSELVLAEDSWSMARHAARRGWIPDGMISKIKAAQLRDESRG